MPELVVIAPLAPIRVGDQFEQGTVPLHLTTLPKIRVPQNEVPAVLSTISDVAASTGPVTVTAAGYARFGRAGNIQVTTVEISVELRRLHRQLLEGIQSAGASPLELAYNGDGYRPHITHTHDGRAITPGEPAELTKLAVLDCSRLTQRITAIWPLAGSDPKPPASP